MNAQKKLLPLFFLLFAIITGSYGCSSSYGSFFTLDKVNQLHGPVIQKVGFTPGQFQTFLAQTNNLLMFIFKDDKLIIAGDGRNVIYPDSASISPDDTLMVFSKTNIEDLLLNNGPADSVYVGKRSNTISITYYNSTLEEPVPCPPNCH